MWSPKVSRYSYPGFLHRRTPGSWQKDWLWCCDIGRKPGSSGQSWVWLIHHNTSHLHNLTHIKGSYYIINFYPIYPILKLIPNNCPCSESDVPRGRREYWVGQYVVQLQAFEQTALPVLRIKVNGTPCASLVTLDLGRPFCGLCPWYYYQCSIKLWN